MPRSLPLRQEFPARSSSSRHPASPSSLDPVATAAKDGATAARRSTGAGRIAFRQAVAPRGYGALRHTHPDFDEAIYVQTGRIFIEAGDGRTTRRLDPGAFVLVPRGQPHALYNPGPQEVRLMLLSAPIPGFELLFLELHQAMVQAGLAPGVDTLFEIAARHGVTLLPAA